MGKKGNKTKSKTKRLKLIDFTPRERAVSIIEYILLAGLIVTSFCVFFYTDYSDTLDNSIMLGDSILNGKFRDFYEYAAVNKQKLTSYSANYDVFIYIVFLIWNLPVFIAHRIKEFDYMNTLWSLLWCKGLILGFTIGAAELVRRIADKLGANRKTARFAALLFTASTMVIIPEFVTVQYDIIAIFLMLLGLMFYFKGGKSMKWFYLVFALAVPMKTFAIFVYIPLILYREKRVLWIILKMIPAFSVNLLCRLMFIGSASYQMAMSTQTRDAIKVITESTVTLGKFGINLFVICYLALLVLCYRMEDDGSKFKPVYISALAMSSFILFVNIRSYWMILAAPFLVLIILTDRSKIKLNVLIFTLGSFCGTVYYLMSHWPLSNENIVNHLVLKGMFDKLPDTKEPVYAGGIKEFFASHDLIQFAPVMYSIFIGAVILLLILNRPSQHKDDIRDYTPEWWMGLLQIGLTWGIVALLIIVGTMVRYVPVVSFTVPSDYMGGSLLKGMTIEQDFTAPRDQDISEVSFIAINDGLERTVRNSMNITIKDKTTGEQVGYATVNSAMIPDQEMYTMKMGKVHLTAGHTYTVIFSATTRNHFSDRLTVGMVATGDNKPAARLGTQDLDMAVGMTVR